MDMREAINLVEGAWDPEDIEEIWDCHLDGCSMAYISQYKTDLPLSAIKKILAGPIPEKFANDERRQPTYFVWVSQNDAVHPFIIIELPRKITQANYRKGVTAIRRLAPELSIIFQVTEPIEREVAQKFIAKGYPAFSMALNGTAKHYNTGEGA